MKWADSLCRERVIGLDVCDGNITAAFFNGDEPESGLRHLVTGTYDLDASDRQISRAIHELWRREKLPTRTVQTCLYTRSLLVRHFRYENLDRKELPDVLMLEAEEALQLPANKISMDWQVNTEKTSSSSKHNFKIFSGVLIAAPREKVTRHLNMIRTAGLYSIGVHASCSASGNLYSWLVRKKNSAPVCLVNLTRRLADIIMHTGTGQYPRTLFCAENRWTENADYLQENIQDALLYYHLKLKQPPIEKILLAGVQEGLEALSEALFAQTSLPVELFDISTEEKVIPAPLAELASCDCINAIGLSLRKEWV